jgi:hypothetical protein
MDEAFELRQTMWGRHPFHVLEAVWLRKQLAVEPVWLLNLSGDFLIPIEEYPEPADFLCAALRHTPSKMPTRGPQILSNRIYQYEHKRFQHRDGVSWHGHEAIYGLCRQSPLYYGEYECVIRALPRPIHSRPALCAS